MLNLPLVQACVVSSVISPFQCSHSSLCTSGRRFSGETVGELAGSGRFSAAIAEGIDKVARTPEACFNTTKLLSLAGLPAGGLKTIIW